MLRFVLRAKPLCFGAFVVLISCTVPPLKSQLEHGPTVSDIVNHINCELKSVVTKRNGRLAAQIEADPPLSRLIDYLTKYHFVASVLMTLDVLDSENLNPTVNFITPLPVGTMFNNTLAVGASLTGSQERNIGLSYSVDLEHVVHECHELPREQTGIGGDLGLSDIVVDGLRGLQTARVVNVYGNSGPTVPTFTADIGNWTLSAPALTDLKLTGSVTYSPSSSELQAPGTVTLTGTLANDQGDSYLTYLTGSTFLSQGNNSITLSGALTQASISNISGPDTNKLGFAPKLSLSGTTGGDFSGFVLNSAVITVDTSTTTLTGDAAKFYQFTITQPSQGSRARVAQAPSAPAPGGSAKGGGATSGGGGGTQFSSQVVFTLSYGVGGGVNWTLQRFNGPGAGNTNSLVGASRTATDTLTITFVAACRNHSPTLKPQDYWQSLPQCDVYGAGQKQAAAATGAFTNQLMQFPIRP